MQIAYGATGGEGIALNADWLNIMWPRMGVALDTPMSDPPDGDKAAEARSDVVADGERLHGLITTVRGDARAFGEAVQWAGFIE